MTRRFALALALALAACHAAATTLPSPPIAPAGSATPATPAGSTAPFASFDGGGGAPSVTCDEADPRVRRHYDGEVIAIDHTDHGWAIVVKGKMQRLVADDQGPIVGGNPWKVLPDDPAAADRDRFFIAMPTHVPLPLAVGDAVWAEMWTVQVGAFAFDSHAWVSRNADGPVLVVDELLPGWSASPGGRTGTSRWGRKIAFTPPGLAPTDVDGWARGRIASVDYAVYGTAEILDLAPGEPVPNDWSNIFQHATVRLGR